MSTLKTKVLINTIYSQFYIDADKELLDFLKTARPEDTHILRSYYNLPIPEGDFYVDKKM